jgi:carbamoyl-phosphate synthase/aspartate carbamoyltransferase
LLSVAACDDNADRIGNVVPDAASLFIPYTRFDGPAMPKIASVAKHFNAWPPLLPVVTDATGNDLASLLLFASLHNRAIHVTNVNTRDDIDLIALSKEKGLKVTCDVAVYSLFLSTNDIDDAKGILPTPNDQAALWERLDVIDCFTVGTLPYRLALQLGKKVVPSNGIEETLPLLFNAVNKSRLTVDDITRRLYNNPCRIFDMPEQPDTYVEVEIDRITRRDGSWSPFAKRELLGTVSRVVLRSETVYLDGGLYSNGENGRDVSVMTHVITKMPVKEPTQVQEQHAILPVPPSKAAVATQDIVSPTLAPGDIVPKTVAPEWPLELSVTPA